MKKNIIILGALLSLFMAVFIFYVANFPRSYMSWVVRIGLPGLMALAALYFRSKEKSAFPFYPATKANKMRLIYFLSPLVFVSSALILFLVPHLFFSFLVVISTAIFSGIAAALFWQGYVWPNMKKSGTLFRSAFKLTLFQMLFMVTVMFVGAAPLLLMHFLPSSLSFLSIAKLFNEAILFVSLVVGFGVTLFLGAVMNYWLLTMQERTQSLLYPALAYGISWSVVLSATFLRGAYYPFAGLARLLIVVAGISVFIALYRGSNDKQTGISPAK